MCIENSTVILLNPTGRFRCQHKAFDACQRWQTTFSPTHTNALGSVLRIEAFPPGEEGGWGCRAFLPPAGACAPPPSPPGGQRVAPLTRPSSGPFPRAVSSRLVLLEEKESSYATVYSNYSF